VSANPAIVKDFQLLPLVRVALVGNSFGILGLGEIRSGIRAIAIWLVGRLAATAQLHLMLTRKFLAKPVSELSKIRDEVGTVERNSYFRFGI
jgi:hypothetical protein